MTAGIISRPFFVWLQTSNVPSGPSQVPIQRTPDSRWHPAHASRVEPARREGASFSSPHAGHFQNPSSAMTVMSGGRVSSQLPSPEPSQETQWSKTFGEGGREGERE